MKHPYALLITVCSLGCYATATAPTATAPTARGSAGPPADASRAGAPEVSTWPACTKVELDRMQWQRVPPDARAAVRALGEAVAANDPARLAAVLGPGVTVEGTPQVAVGFKPNDPETDWCEWRLEFWTFDDEANQFEVFTGSGYGVTNVAVFGLVGAVWKVVALTKIDYGEP